MMEIHIRLEQSDFAAFQRRLARRIGQPGRWLWAAAVGILVFGVFSFAEGQAATSAAVRYVLLGSAIGVVLTLFWIARRSRRASRLDPAGYVLGPQHIRFTEHGIEIRKAGSESLTHWSAVRSIEETKEHYFVFLDTVVAHIIPKRDLGSDQARQRVAEALRGYVPEWKTHASAPPTAVDAATATGAGLSGSRLRRNLRAGTRLAMFQRVNTDEFVFSAGQIAGFIVIELAIILCHDYLSAWPRAAFNIYGVTASATYYLLFFLSAFLIAQAADDSGSAHKFVLIVLTFAPITMTVYFAGLWMLKFVGSQVGAAWIAWWLFVVWVCILVFRAVGLVFNAPRRQAVSLSVLFWLFNFGTVLVLPGDRFWYADTRSAYDIRPVNVENTYYRQPDLLKAWRVLPERPGVVDLYFVGFGSYARQDVFLSEVQYTKTLFDDKFDTEGRSVVLANNRRTVDEIPLANGSNLRHVLADISGKMNPEEDILFLFMTSHGSKNARLAVRFWPLRPNDITAPQLRKMLDDSGIKWRVILISACYAGSFLEELKDDHTLIMTAAAKDKQSFGCSNERRFTYFGEAYLVDALQQQRSWVKAFEQAKAAIKKREQQEGISASNPQLHVGQRMQAKLTQFEHRLP